MTAVVIISIIGLIAFVFLVAGIVNIRQVKVKEVQNKNQKLNKTLLKIEELAEVERELSNPLAWGILDVIRTYRRENS